MKKNLLLKHIAILKSNISRILSMILSLKNIEPFLFTFDRHTHQKRKLIEKSCQHVFFYFFCTINLK